MLVGQDLLGVISVYSTPAKHRRFSLEDANRLTGLAKQATLAIYSDRLQMRDRYLLAASERLTSQLEIDSVATTMLDLLKEAIPYDSASVQDLRSDYFTIIECDGFEKRDAILGRTYSINDSTPNREVYETKRCVVFDDIRDEYPNVVDPNDSQDIRSWLGIPLLLSQKIVGMVVLDRRGEIQPFTKEEIETANLFLRHASIALNNAKSYRISRMLYQLASALGRADELEDAGNALLKGLSTIIEFNSATLQLIARDGIKRRIVAASNVDEPSPYLVRPISDDPLVTEIVSSKQTMVLSYTEDAEETLWEQREDTAHVKSWIGTPLVYGNKVVGLLTLDHRKPGYYKKSDISLIELVAAQAAVTVENVRLLDELDFQLRRLHDAQSLAMIGLIYGEDLHLTSNKLGAARQFARNINNGLVPHDEIEEFADYIATSISEVLDLIAAIEDTVQAPDSEDISISELIDEVISAMRLGPNIDVQIEKLPENDIVHGFKQQIGQVIRVVIFNAKEAMDNRGRIRIDLEELQKRNENFLQVSIQDNGRGIPTHIQPKVFEIGNPRKRRQRRGFGFGLAWSRLFLRWYGGDMSFETKVNKGTTMYIDLPRVFKRDA
jgi:GAF domain-containing protein